MKKFLVYFTIFCSLSVAYLSQSHALTMACTMEAKMCPDGETYVWRTWPNCEFAACPWETKPKACTREYNPVCGQPKQTNPLAGIAVPKTYSNKCVMESEWATLLNHGKCIGDFWPKVQQSLDDKIDQLIEKIETKLSSVAQKKSVVDKMLLKLETKIKTFSHLEGVIQYIKSRLEEYVSNL